MTMPASDTILKQPPLELYDYLVATIIGIIAEYHRITVQSTIADARLPPIDMKSKLKKMRIMERRMLRPGFEPGISDSKGRYA
jgi:hypothetical protein